MREVVMPKLGMISKQGKVLKWLKKEGEKIEEKEPLLEIESEKITYTVEAPSSGTLQKIIVGEGQEVPVGTTIGIIEVSEKSREIKEETAEVLGLPKIAKVIPLKELREKTSQRLFRSYSEAVHVTMMMEVDAYKLVDFYEKVRQEVEKSSGAKLTYTTLLVKAAALSLRDHLILNSMLEKNEIKVFENINVGVAVSTDAGLLVPVIKDADKKSLAQIAFTLKELVEKAKRGELTASELSGGTFTVSNLGMYGVDIFTSIINPPECAILGIGKITRKPVVLNEDIVVRPMMFLILTFDHRIVDGTTAANFLNSIKKILEEPQILMT
ncbi:MAG: dihydrolipoamide acetyltransferase family protein [Candidatus Hadarchaeum sp.]|uniref:dihydrolipoamide acetyltransferase family protein n=1 Tax=Candidatus Hadarchaeum sp. TaxID=2883567 RepID=UPI003177623A